MTPRSMDKTASRVSRDEAIAFLEGACRNWSSVPKLSEDDIGDVASELLRFVSARSLSDSVSDGSKGVSETARWLDEYLSELRKNPNRYADDIEGLERVAAALSALDSGTGGQQPVAWQHCLVNPDGYEYDGEVNTSGKHPFGRPGRDYDASFSVISRPLYPSLTEPKAGVVSEEMVERAARALALCAWQRFDISDSAFARNRYPNGADQYVEMQWSLYANDARAVFVALNGDKP
ncbi:hypothetical protein FF80_03298 [Devosia sp. LC5]|uniref:hypothetical protein n=1 Tax=Devosia sp. LC5 TaxID=1502724 RepID=UPI0004E387FC|nr:hypothetical protein [Devosia sp. LC5]KFC62731.1 hypothetical protein FF80_03298 [Devosia sp. LC5]